MLIGSTDRFPQDEGCQKRHALLLLGGQRLVEGPQSIGEVFNSAVRCAEAAERRSNSPTGSRSRKSTINR
jgi:hypothetical protein